jgi:hypothetical protein
MTYSRGRGDGEMSQRQCTVAKTEETGGGGLPVRGTVVDRG